MPNYLAIGVDFNFVLEHSPRELKPFYKAHKLKRQMEDEMNWLSGQYVLSAFSVVVSAALSKHSKAKYMEKPILQEMKESNKSADEILETQMEVFVHSFASTDLPPTVFKDIRKGET